MSFVKRAIELRFDYGTGPQGQGAPKTVELTGHRVSVHVDESGGLGMGMAQVRIWGMSLSLMNELSTLGQSITLLRKNFITIKAGNVGGVLAQIFQGTIIAAWADMSTAPEVCFNVTAGAGAFEAVQPTAISTYQDSVKAEVLLEDLAGRAGLAFENNGATAVLGGGPYFIGSPRDQIMKVLEHTKPVISGIISNGVLAIWPANGYRAGTVPVVSPETGMVGYPSYTATGIIVTTLFNPAVRFGALVEIVSSVTPACGNWYVYKLIHDIEAELPSGRWFTQMQLAKPGVIVVK